MPTIRFEATAAARTADRGASFAAAATASYRVTRDGVVVGTVEVTPNAPLALVNPAFAGRGDLWTFLPTEGDALYAQRLNDLRRAVRAAA